MTMEVEGMRVSDKAVVASASVDNASRSPMKLGDTCGLSMSANSVLLYNRRTSIAASPST
jgi:hypothetical protein